MNTMPAAPPSKTVSKMATPAPDTFPRWVLLTAGGVVAFSLMSVGLVRLTGNGPDQLAAAAALAGSQQSRALRFEDRPDGSIAVRDGVTGAELDVVRGEQGFLRGSLRALTRERKARGLGAEVPFQLTPRADGGLTLSDPLTAQRVDLDSFGPTNMAVFERLLTAKIAKPPSNP
jgi:putative photosynthetic complex assembly protein